MKTVLIWILIGFLITACIDTKRYGECETSEKVKFRSLNFEFPLDGTKVKEIANGKLTHNYRWLKTDSLMRDGEIYWFFNGASNKNDRSDSTNFLRNNLIFGVTIHLLSEVTKSEAEVIKELQKDYPGDYIKLTDYNKLPYYVYSKGCLKIIVQRGFSTNIVVPRISFVYGLSDDKVEIYASSMGNLVYTE